MAESGTSRAIFDLKPKGHRFGPGVNVPGRRVKGTGLTIRITSKRDPDHKEKYRQQSREERVGCLLLLVCVPALPPPTSDHKRLLTHRIQLYRAAVKSSALSRFAAKGGRARHD